MSGMAASLAGFESAELGSGRARLKGTPCDPVLRLAGQGWHTSKEGPPLAVCPRALTHTHTHPGLLLVPHITPLGVLTALRPST